ncbi:hypothetical protein E4U54_004160 [Claviceps lovelessii]|nr:hypothetical protein E4U54_004160 [Claviceps lovelessii]
MLQDDPQFDPLAMLPRLDEILSYDMRTNLISTQESCYKFSQLSPMDTSAVPSACTSRRSSMVGLDLPPSSLSVGSYQLPGTLCHSSPFNKAFREPEAMQVDRPFAEHEFDFDPIYGMGLEFDADGNLVNIMDAEPQLPPLRGTSPDPLHSADPAPAQAGGWANQQMDQALNEESLVDFGEAALPDAEAFVVQVQPADGQATGTDGLLTPTTETAEAGNTSAAMHAIQGRALRRMVDREIRVPRDVFRAWTENYAASMQSAARRRVKSTTLAKAKANALRLMYSNGISGVGAMQQELGVQHPLAADFAGTALKAHMLGLTVDVIEKTQATRGRRRKSPEAFDDDDDDDDQGAQENGRNTRNVKQRLDHGDQLGRRHGRQPSIGFGDELELPFGDDSAPEIGMEAAPAMEDRNSSLVLMPWSRHGSAVPGSATRAPGSAQKSITAPSPLHGRGSIVGSIERHSDPVEEPFKHVIGLGPEPDSSLLGQDPDDADLNGPDNSNNQGSIAGLDMSSHDFLDYVTEQIQHHGVSRLNPQDGKSWIRFEQLASPAIHSKMVAAQAFLHILSLASKNVIAVEQDGLQNKEPFGTLHIGFTTHVSRTEKENSTVVAAESG